MTMPHAKAIKYQNVSNMFLKKFTRELFDSLAYWRNPVPRSAGVDPQ